MFRKAFDFLPKWLKTLAQSKSAKLTPENPVLALRCWTMQSTINDIIADAQKLYLQ